jgi:hypothetical protein
MTYSHAQHILAAFCYATAMMLWVLGSTLIYYGCVPLWFIVILTALFIVSGISFDLEGVYSMSGGGEASHD